MIYVAIGCLVCNEPVKLNELEKCQLDYGHHISPKLCPKCKEAILHTRKELEEKKSSCYSKED